MDLTTTYLGLALRNPLVASPSPLSRTVDDVRRLVASGVGAVVLYSLFEEQVRRRAAQDGLLADAGADSFAEALSYFPATADDETGPRRYLSLLERAVAAVDVPVIASLNGATPGGWQGYARAMQDAGAAAIELNVYYLPGDPSTSGRDVEQRHLDALARVRAAVSVPVAVKIGPYFSSTGEMATRLDAAGADGLVLFNRWLQPEIDPETLAGDLGHQSLDARRGPAGTHLDRPAAWARGRLARRDGRGRDVGRRRPAPPRRSGRRHDGISVASPRARLRGRAPRRAVAVVAAQGLHRARGLSRPALGADDR